MSQMMEIPHTQISPVALQIEPGISFEQWTEMGKQLGRVNQGLQWWIGDWLTYGEKSYGETYAQAMDVTGRPYDSVKQCAYVARKFPPEQRRDALTFSHYQAVSGMPPEIAQRLLVLADDNDWTVKELRVQRKSVETKADDKPVTITLTVCPECGAAFKDEDAGKMDVESKDGEA